jgi:hypothetical protein
MTAESIKTSVWTALMARGIGCYECMFAKVVPECKSYGS